MKIRAKANGNILDVDDATAQMLIERGLCEKLEAPAEPSPDITKDAVQEKSGKYRRRDLTAEK